MRSRTAWRVLFGILVAFLVLGVPVAIGGSDEDRRTVLGLLLTVGVVAGLWWLDREFRREPRRRAAEDEGERLGLRPATDDTWIRDLDLDLLRLRGTIQDVSNVLEGTWHGEPAATFEYRWATEENERRYSCACLRVPTSWPRLVIVRETSATRLAREVGLRDVETEWHAFNSAFRLGSTDVRFAISVVDGRMMEWLMARPPAEGFELAGGWAIAYTAQVLPWEIERVLETARAFRERIPPVVTSLFGGGAPPIPPRPDAVEGPTS